MDTKERIETYYIYQAVDDEIPEMPTDAFVVHFIENAPIWFIKIVLQIATLVHCAHISDCETFKEKLLSGIPRLLDELKDREDALCKRIVESRYHDRGSA